MNDMEQMIEKARTLLKLTDVDIDNEIKNRIKFADLNVTEFVTGLENFMIRYEALIKSKCEVVKKLTKRLTASEEYKLTYKPSPKDLVIKTKALEEKLKAELKAKQEAELNSLIDNLLLDAQREKEAELEAAKQDEIDLMREKLKSYLLQH